MFSAGGLGFVERCFLASLPLTHRYRHVLAGNSEMIFLELTRRDQSCHKLELPSKNASSLFPPAVDGKEMVMARKLRNYGICDAVDSLSCLINLRPSPIGIRSGGGLCQNSANTGKLKKRPKSWGCPKERFGTGQPVENFRCIGTRRMNTDYSNEVPHTPF
jgi:hypothetical protein